MNEARSEEIISKVDDLLFDIRRSTRYHVMRRRHYEQFNKITSAINVISGSATFIGVIRSYSIISILAPLFVTVASTMDLVISTAQMARLHADLAMEFVNLEKDIIVSRNSINNDSDISKYIATRLSIEAKEPPQMRVLNMLCYNEQSRSTYGCDAPVFRIGLFRSMLCQWVDFFPDRVHLPEDPLPKKDGK